MATAQQTLGGDGLPIGPNPYTCDGTGFGLVPSVLCFLDVLGYRQTIINGGDTAGGAFHQALAASYPAMLAEMGVGDLGLQDIPVFALKTFTDNIVLARPIGEDGESELGNVTMAVAALQTNLALQGYFVRGAIAIGPAYVDDYGVFGSALIEAYEGETQLARDPRIILCESALQSALQHISYYRPSAHSPQNLIMRRDSDEQAFVNYLEHLAPAPSEGGFGYEELTRHRDIVIQQLELFRAQPVIWSKYEWVARYHNDFCERYADLCGDSYDIPTEAFQRPFRDLAPGAG